MRWILLFISYLFISFVSLHNKIHLLRLFLSPLVSHYVRFSLRKARAEGEATGVREV